jgi:hypothetical protein
MTKNSTNDAAVEMLTDEQLSAISGGDERTKALIALWDAYHSLVKASQDDPDPPVHVPMKL